VRNSELILECSSAKLYHIYCAKTRGYATNHVEPRSNLEGNLFDLISLAKSKLVIHASNVGCRVDEVHNLGVILILGRVTHVNSVQIYLRDVLELLYVLLKFVYRINEVLVAHLQCYIIKFINLILDLVGDDFNCNFRSWDFEPKQLAQKNRS